MKVSKGEWEGEKKEKKYICKDFVRTKGKEICCACINTNIYTLFFIQMSVDT